MTIYTDQVTGKKYDRVHGGVVGGVVGKTGKAQSCRDCAFAIDIKQCASAIEHCVIDAPSKTVFFVFKERKA